MLNEKKKIICLYPDCSKPATRVLTYFVDPPTVPSKAPKQEVFCDEHAEAEMLDLKTPGLFTQTKWDGTKVNCTVNQLTNCRLEDDCCHEPTKSDKLAPRVGTDACFLEDL